MKYYIKYIYLHSKKEKRFCLYTTDKIGNIFDTGRNFQRAIELKLFINKNKL